MQSEQGIAHYTPPMITKSDTFLAIVQFSLKTILGVYEQFLAKSMRTN
jgi:hypothetical protein